MNCCFARCTAMSILVIIIILTGESAPHVVFREALHQVIIKKTMKYASLQVEHIYLQYNQNVLLEKKLVILKSYLNSTCIEKGLLFPLALVCQMLLKTSRKNLRFDLNLDQTELQTVPFTGPSCRCSPNYLTYLTYLRNVIAASGLHV